MLNLRRNHIHSGPDARKDPRIEFHFPATIIGLDTKAELIDLSLGGFFIESRIVDALKTGQRLNIALKLPDEVNGITAKTEVVYLTKIGFGCKLCRPTPKVLQTLERCFAVFSGTLPVLPAYGTKAPIDTT